MASGDEAASKIVEDAVKARNVSVPLVLDDFFDDDPIGNVFISCTFVLAGVVL